MKTIRPVLNTAIGAALIFSISHDATADETRYKISTPVWHEGALDGSAAISSGTDHFIGATDEENTLRLFSSTGGQAGSVLQNLNQWKPFPKKLDDDGKTYKEADIEGAAKIGNVIYWISSHANNSKGKTRLERQVFFATKCTGEGVDTKLEPLGTPYIHLLKDLVADARTKFLQPMIEASIPPKAEKGFNIESLCAVGDQLCIGFRNPIIDGKALLVHLTNPQEVIHNEAKAVLGEPIYLFLEGLGFRDMVKWHGGFLIVAGDYRDRFEDSEALPPKLFLWSGKKEDTHPTYLKVDLLDLNPEAALVFGEEKDGRVLILSDDGKFKADNPEEQQEKKGPQFRSVWLEAVK